MRFENNFSFKVTKPKRNYGSSDVSGHRHGYTAYDAITRAGGLAENAGAAILVTEAVLDNGRQIANARSDEYQCAALSAERMRRSTCTWKVEKISGSRRPARVFVLGRVKKPGAFYITDGAESSIMKALALSEGLDTFPSHKAYIYRVEGGSGARNEIPIDLKRIMDRKSPDVALMANDILYVPDATGARASLKVIETSVGIAAGVGTALVYAYH